MEPLSTPLTGDYERDLNAFISKNRGCTRVRPWLLYIGTTCPAEQRPRIANGMPATGTWIAGISKEDALSVAGRFMEPDAVARSFAELDLDKTESDALGLDVYPYLAFDHTGLRVGAIRDEGPMFARDATPPTRALA